MSSITSLAIISATCLAAALIGGRVTAPQIPTWYAGLRKPKWTPPRLAFPIVWPILYILIAIAGWLLWESLPSERRTLALAAFFVQLALNAAWSPVFFGAHRLLAGLIVIITLDVAIIVTIAAAWPVEKSASLLLLPYLAWTGFATALNARIWTLNRST
jgi:benzodiazapine receptor